MAADLLDNFLSQGRLFDGLPVRIFRPAKLPRRVASRDHSKSIDRKDILPAPFLSRPGALPGQGRPDRDIGPLPQSTFFSGHGTQIRDRHGDDLKDYMDEAICPWDTSWDGGLILDDDLSAFFATLKKRVTLEVILDSCHSGSGTRDLTMGSDIRSRFLAPPIDIECRAEEDLPVKKLAARKVEKGLNHVLWAGCRDNQTSADAMIGNAYNGAFTYFFCKHIREAQGKIARSELLKRVRASLKHNGFSQIPQLELPSETAKKTTIFRK